MDSTALALEYDYFLRRMLEAEMYAVLDTSSYFADAEAYEGLMDIYSHRLADSLWTGGYKPESIEVSLSNAVLVNRAKSYLTPLISVPSTELTFGLIGQAKNVRSYHDLMLSYAHDTVNYSSLTQQLSNSDDMLFQTRHSVGTFVMDSVYNVAYSSRLKQNHEYLNNVSST